jgi:uncharacterized protein YecE (DUF72 family)
MNLTKTGVVRIGTSGIVLPGPKTTFPETFQSGTRLHYYSVLFDTLEINSTFYKIPRPSTFVKWSNEASDNFKFTVKLWKGITHAKRLLYTITDIDTFMRAADGLGNKKGCLLVQFPASITFEYFIEVEKIVQRLHEINIDGDWKLCIELRHASWYQEITYTMLNLYNTSLVLHDIAASRTPMHDQDSDIIYLRFHGPNGDYKGSYTDEFIQDHAEKINEWTKEGKDVYVYFNNTAGNALQNAQLLQKLLHIKK